MLKITSGSETAFLRLHSLGAYGYRPLLGVAAGMPTVECRHDEHDAVVHLWPDGTVYVSVPGQPEATRIIGAEDGQEFDQFVRSAGPARARAVSPAFDRLHQLAKRGYEPDLRGASGPDELRLNHAGKGPPLVLGADGWMRQSPHGTRKAAFIGAHDSDGFTAFLKSVPTSLARQRLSKARVHFFAYMSVIYRLAFLVVLVKAGLLLLAKLQGS